MANNRRLIQTIDHLKSLSFSEQQKQFQKIDRENQNQKNLCAGLFRKKMTEKHLGRFLSSLRASNRRAFIFATQRSLKNLPSMYSRTDNYDIIEFTIFHQMTSPTLCQANSCFQLSNWSWRSPDQRDSILDVFRLVTFIKSEVSEWNLFRSRQAFIAFRKNLLKMSVVYLFCIVSGRVKSFRTITGHPVQEPK